MISLTITIIILAFATIFIVALFNNISKIYNNFKLIIGPELKRGFEEWRKFYTKFLWLKDSKFLAELLVFAFLIIFIGILLYLNLFFIKLILKNSLDPSSYSLFLVIFLIVLLYTIIGFSLFDKGSGYNLYYLAFVSILLSLLNISFVKILLLSIAWLLALPGIYCSWKRPEWKIFTIIIPLFIILLLGTSLLYSVYGDKDEKILFRDCYRLNIIPNINMTCENGIGGLSHGKISDFETACKITPNLENITGEIDILFANGTKLNRQIEEGRIKLLPNARTKEINFKVNGTYKNESLCMDITWQVFFKPYEEHKSDREKFFAYMFALWGIVFITVPPLISRLFDLVNSRKLANS